MKRPLFILLAAQVALQTVAAQQPRFRAGVDVVLVDVNVVDDAGRPIEGLQASDFSVSVDGKPRRVVSASFISDASPRPPSQAAHSGAQGATPAPGALVSSNDASRGGRLILILIDQENIRAGAGRGAMVSAQHFVDTLQPADRVGLLAFPNGPGVELTTDHAKVREQLARIVGREPATPFRKNVGLAEAFGIERSDPGLLDRAVARECVGLTERLLDACREEVEADARLIVQTSRERTRASLTVIHQVLANLAKIDGPKTVVLISESLVIGTGTGDMTETALALRQVATAAATARVTIFALRLDRSLVDVTAQAPVSLRIEDQQMRAEGLGWLATATRGTLFNVVASSEGVFSRIALELSGHYLLALEAEANDRDGKAHAIDVRASRSGVHLRSRREFVWAPADAALTDEAALRRVLTSPLPATDIALRVTTYVLRHPQNSRLRLMIALDVGRDLDAPQEMAVAVVVQDPQGKVRANSFERASLAPRHLPGALAYETSAAVEPGEYTLRIAVRDKEGHTGSVEHPVSAHLASASPVQVSDLVLADEDPKVPGKWRPGVDGRLANQLAVYLEVYSGDKDILRNAAVRLEVAESESAPALLAGKTGAGEIASGGRRAITGRVGIDLLPPGTYVARAVVMNGDRAVARAVRPFVVSAPAATADTRPASAHTVPFSDLARRFDVKQVLDPAVVNPFLDRLVAAGAPAGPSRIGDAVALARRGTFDTSLESIAAGNELAPTFLRGLALLSRGSIEEAANEFRAALRASSDFFPAAFYLGACYAAGGRDDEAVGAWQTTLAGESDVRIAYLALFDALVRLNDWTHAFDIAQEALQQWPDEAPVQRRAAAALSMLGDQDEALAVLRRYLARHGDDQEALLLAMRLIVQSRLHGNGEAATSDAREFARYAQEYDAANGPQKPLVAVWSRYLAQR